MGPQNIWLHIIHETLLTSKRQDRFTDNFLMRWHWIDSKWNRDSLFTWLISFSPFSSEHDEWWRYPIHCNCILRIPDCGAGLYEKGHIMEINLSLTFWLIGPANFMESCLYFTSNILKLITPNTLHNLENIYILEDKVEPAFCHAGEKLNPCNAEEALKICDTVA